MDEEKKFLWHKSDNEEEIVHVIDIEEMDMNIEDIMYNVARQLFRLYYPEEEIPVNSVYVGRVYENKYTKNCQINFSKNNFIVKCKYICSSREIHAKSYELTHHHMAWCMKEQDDDEKKGIFYSSDDKCVN